MTNYKPGDRFYILTSDRHNLQYKWILLVSEYKINSTESPTSWHLQWEGLKSATGTIRFSELKSLKLFGNNLVPIKNEKHLLELKLRHG